MDWEAIEHLLRDIHAKRRGNSATQALGHSRVNVRGSEDRLWHGSSPLLGTGP
jgi:hypothetical protein